MKSSLRKKANVLRHLQGAPRKFDINELFKLCTIHKLPPCLQTYPFDKPALPLNDDVL